MGSKMMNEQLGGDRTYLPDPITREELGLDSDFDPVTVTVTVTVMEASDSEWLNSVKSQIEAEDNIGWYADAFFDDLFRREDTAKIRKLDRETDVIPTVTIGPYHRNCKDQVIFNDDYKWAVTRYIAKQWTSFDSSIYLREMAEKETMARSYYKDDFRKEISHRDFLVMLLLDSAFILFMLDALGNKELLSSGRDRLDHEALLFKVKDSIMRVKIDLLTLDNQIPFFAVEQLYVIGRSGKADYYDYDLQEKVRALVLSGFDDLYPKKNQDKSADLRYIDFHHLLHLFHWSRVPEGKYGSVSQTLQRTKDLVLHIPSATELQKCAMTFQGKASGSFLDITFQDSLTKLWGRMSIPTVYLDEYSRDLFLNLIAFEMNFIENGCCMIAYCKCMSRILQHEDDVKLLRDEGIVASTSYKDANVVKFFEDFNKQVENQSMPEDLYDLYAEVRKHHERRISNYFGRTKLQYFPNWWVRLSIVAGIVLFLLTLLQTVYSLLGYYNPFSTTK